MSTSRQLRNTAANSPQRSTYQLLLMGIGLAVGLSVVSCGGQDDAGDNGRLTVFAAASLTETFTELESAFEAGHPGVDVVISFGSSSTLTQQIASGAPADVVATADDASMGAVADAQRLAGDPVPFASNTMVIATPPGNPADIDGVSDLDSADFVMCDPSAPCGAAAQRIVSRLPAQPQPRSLEPDVKSVLAKLTLEEADAGFVYVTDARAAGDAVDTVDIPSDLNVVNAYYIAAVKESPSPDVAADWISLVTSQAGQRVFEAAGFGAA